MSQNFTLNLRLDPQSFAADTGTVFRGLTISQNGSGFNVILRGTSLKGEPVYAMVQHDDPGPGLQILYDCLMARGGASMWRKDRYANGSK